MFTEREKQRSCEPSPSSSQRQRPAGYTISQESPEAILKCCITGALSDADFDRLTVELFDRMTEARRHSPQIRMLWDNRELASPSADGIRAMTKRLTPLHVPGDRIAVLVSSSIMKGTARQRTSEAEVFMSESAALIWLNAWE